VNFSNWLQPDKGKHWFDEQALQQGFNALMGTLLEE